MSEQNLAGAKSVEELSFEQALQELEGIVKALENGNIELDAAMGFYARGQQLKEHCSKKLQSAKLKVEQIVEQDGKATGVTDLAE